jgi:hypothetical protein
MRTTREATDLSVCVHKWTVVYSTSLPFLCCFDAVRRIVELRLDTSVAEVVSVKFHALSGACEVGPTPPSSAPPNWHEIARYHWNLSNGLALRCNRG